jgi:hypothetical protein
MFKDKNDENKNVVIKRLQDEIVSLKRQLESEERLQKHGRTAMSHLREQLLEANRTKRVYLSANKERDFWVETIKQFIAVAPPEKALGLANEALDRYRELQEEIKRKVDTPEQ